MTSRKPNLRIPLPERGQQELQTSPGLNIRSPRFREEFDAPLSEALLDASLVALITDSMSSPSFQSSTSVDGESGRRDSPSTNGPSSNIQPSLSWSTDEGNLDTDSKRQSRVNDRIREWARRSWGAVRSPTRIRPEDKDYFAARRKSALLATPYSGNITPSELGGLRRASSVFIRVESAIAKLPRSKSE